MAATAAAGADPDIPAKEAPSRAPEEQIEAGQRLQRVRANLRLPDQPFAALPADHDAGLRALHLLDFVRLDIPSSGVPRPDLVAELIANYSSSRGRSSVRGKQIEVSLDSFAKALRLPPYGTPAGSDADAPARASASREFTKVYIGAPAEASAGMKRRLPHILCVKKNEKPNPGYTTELLWELLKQEMEHLIESESTDCVSYYGAFLQRLIWVEMPELFQLPPSEAVAPPALLCVRKEQEINLLATIHENQECCSESDIHKRAEASPKQVDVASKRTWSSAFDSADKGHLLTESHEGNSAPRKSDSASRRSVSRALSFEVAHVADEVFAATPSAVLRKKGRGRLCKVQTAALVEPQHRSPCKVQTALVEPQKRSPVCKLQTALVEPQKRRTTRRSIKSNASRPTPVVDQQAKPKRKFSAKMVAKKQTPARPRGKMVKQMKRKK